VVLVLVLVIVPLLCATTCTSDGITTVLVLPQSLPVDPSRFQRKQVPCTTGSWMHTLYSYRHQYKLVPVVLVLVPMMVPSGTRTTSTGTARNWMERRKRPSDIRAVLTNQWTFDNQVPLISHQHCWCCVRNCNGQSSAHCTHVNYTHTHDTSRPFAGELPEKCNGARICDSSQDLGADETASGSTALLSMQTFAASLCRHSKRSIHALRT
jgi:hypothetical protein